MRCPGHSTPIRAISNAAMLALYQHLSIISKLAKSRIDRIGPCNKLYLYLTQRIKLLVTDCVISYTLRIKLLVIDRIALNDLFLMYIK